MTGKPCRRVLNEIDMMESHVTAVLKSFQLLIAARNICFTILWLRSLRDAIAAAVAAAAE